MKNKDDKLSSLFLSSGCLSKEAIRLYLTNTADENQMHAIGDHLSDCDLCSTAVEGYSILAEEMPHAKIASIVTEIEGNVSAKTEKSVGRKYLKPLLAMAAMLIILFASYMIFKNLYTEKEAVIATLADQHKTEATVSDSINAPVNKIIPDEQSDAQLTVASQNGEAALEVNKNITIQNKRSVVNEKSLKGQNDLTLGIVKDMPVNSLQAEGSGTGITGTNKLAELQPGSNTAQYSFTTPNQPTMTDSFILSTNNAYVVNTTAPVSEQLSRKSTKALKSKAPELQEPNEIESLPEFPGGNDSLKMFFKRNMRYPENDVQGNVYMSFFVETNGSVTDIKVKRSLGGGCDEEAVRLIKMMPKWIPGKQNGKPVRVMMTVPVRFMRD